MFIVPHQAESPQDTVTPLTVLYPFLRGHPLYPVFIRMRVLVFLLEIHYPLSHFTAEIRK